MKEGYKLQAQIKRSKFGTLTDVIRNVKGLGSRVTLKYIASVNKHAWELKDKNQGRVRQSMHILTGVDQG